MPVQFTKKINHREIKELYQNEKDQKLKTRYKAILLLDQLNNNAAEVGRRLGKSRTTIGLWVQQYNQTGLKGLEYKKQPGRPPRLTRNQQEELKQIILRKLPTDIGWEYPVWDGKSLSHLIKKLFKLTIKVRRCQYLFHEMGFSLQKPRHKFPRADKKEQAIFKRHIKKNSKTWIIKKK